MRGYLQSQIDHNVNKLIRCRWMTNKAYEQIWELFRDRYLPAHRMIHGCPAIKTGLSKEAGIKGTISTRIE